MKRTKKVDPSTTPEGIGSEMFAALRALEKERGIRVDFMIDRIKQALLAAYKRDKDGYTDNVVVELKEEGMRMYVQKQVVEEVTNTATEIHIDAAKKLNAKAAVGDTVNIKIDTQNFCRIAAQTAKQVIIQGIREAERDVTFSTFSSKEHEILSGVVSRIDPATGDITVRINDRSNDRTEALLSRNEQIPGEYYREGQTIRVYLVEVRNSRRGPQVIVSRTHPGFVKRLFELNVPEIASGEVEIRSIAREPGSRTKVAVSGTVDNISPRGACIGNRGDRVNVIVDELNGEKIEVCDWFEDPCAFVASALSPAEVISVELIPGTTKSCRVIVSDDKQSLAIGKEGQNARLAAKLTGCKIDIKSESQAAAEE